MEPEFDLDWEYHEWLAEEQRYRDELDADRELNKQARQIAYEADVRAGRPLSLIPPL